MIYATAIRLQKDLVDQYCYKDCGKISVGGLIDPVLGALSVCTEDYCPHLEKELKDFGKIDGELITLRKLKKS